MHTDELEKRCTALDLISKADAAPSETYFLRPIKSRAQSSV